MGYNIFQEYKKFIIHLVLLIVLVIIQYVFKHDFNDAINGLVKFLITYAGAQTVRYSVLKTSERETINSSPVGESSNKYYAEPKGTIPMGSKTNNSITSFLIVFILSAIISIPFIFSGCTSYTQCYDCTEKPLSWQSEITAITGGKYIHTACGTINLNLVKILKGEFKVGDILKFSYVVKQGEFCAPGDKSVYKIEAETNSDAPPSVIYAESKAILKIP